MRSITRTAGHSGKPGMHKVKATQQFGAQLPGRQTRHKLQIMHMDLNHGSEIAGKAFGQTRGCLLCA